MTRDPSAIAIDRTQPSWRRRLRLFLRRLDDVSYATFVDHLAELYGDRSAFVLDRQIVYPGLGGDVLSYRQVGDFVARAGAALAASGVSAGDRVGLITMNRIEMAFCSFALGRIGAVPVPLNFMLRPPELAHVVARAGITTILCDRPVWEHTVGDPSRFPAVRCWVMVGDPQAPAPAVSLHDLLAAAPAPEPPRRPASMAEPAVLFFTSGTTGLPKGAVLSHEAVTVYFRHHGRFFSLWPRIPEHLGMVVMPVAHAGGYALLMTQLIIGVPAYFVSSFDPVALLDTIERLRPTIFSGTPAMYRMLLEAGALQRDLSSVRVWSGGADAFPDELIATFRRAGSRRTRWRLRRPLFIRGYGMAETNAYLAQTPPFECGDNCLGWVLPPVRYRIVGEDGRDVRRGEAGELWVRGPNVATGYWGENGGGPFGDGWFRTGDIVRRGRFRLLYLVGRSEDVIKSGGYKISAVELDHAIGRHPGVEQVATVGLPHELKGEVPVSAVVLRPGVGEQDILEHAARVLAPYKRPRRVVALPDIPMTFNLKPKRHEVRRRVLERLGSEAAGSERGA